MRKTSLLFTILLTAFIGTASKASPVPSVVTIATNPAPVVECVGTTNYFTALVTGANSFQWERYNGTSWQYINSATMDAGVTYSGYNSDTLYVAASNTSASGFQYKLVAMNIIDTDSSSAAPLTINALPNLYTVSAGGSYCAGGTGVDVTLSGSDTGVVYELFSSAGATGSIVAGTDSMLNLGNVTTAGTYMVLAGNATTYCIDTMTGSATIAVNPLPSVDTVSTGGSFCAGGAGIDVSLSGSDTGVTYQLYVGALAIGAPLAGTDTSINFGNETASGTYWVLATNSMTGCTDTMYGSSVIVVNPVPTHYSISASTGYCMGGSGADVTLSNSDAGINYQLYNGASPAGSPLTGTGSSLDFGYLTSAGDYTIVATNSTTMCTDTMTGTDTVTVFPLPNVYDITGGGSYCAGGAGVHVGLDSSSAGVSYQLYYGISLFGTPMTGTGHALDFGPETGAGTYFVVARDTVTGCAIPMNGTDTVDTISVVIPTLSISTSTFGTICSGSRTVFMASVTNGGSNPIYQWHVNGVNAGSDSVDYTYTPANNDEVSLTVVSNHVCAMPDTVKDSIMMHVLPLASPSVSIVATPSDTVCRGSSVTLRATPTYAGTNTQYDWIINTHLVSSSTSSTYTYTPADSDDIYAIMLTNYQCDTSSLPVAFSGSIYMRVLDPIVPAVTITGRPGITLLDSMPDTLVATVTPTTGTYTYQWYVNGVPVPGNNSPVFHRSSYANKDSVSVLVTRQDACQMATVNSVIINVWNRTAGVGNINGKNNLSLAPNPNNGSFMLNGTLASMTNGEAAIEITNMVGQVVYKSPVTINNGEVNTSINLGGNLPAGMYLLNLRTENGNEVLRFTLTR